MEAESAVVASAVTGSSELARRDEWCRRPEAWGILPPEGTAWAAGWAAQLPAANVERAEQLEPREGVKELRIQASVRR